MKSLFFHGIGIFWLISLIWSGSVMGQTSQGPYSPSSNAANAVPISPSTITNGSNVYVNDENTANFYHKKNGNNSWSIETFGFTIPGGSTIDGIIVELEHYESDLTLWTTFEVGLYQTSGAEIVYKAITPQTSDGDVYTTFGSSSDLWSPTSAWTNTDFNDGNFYAVIHAQVGNGDRDSYYDHMRITVHYTTSAGMSMTIDGMSGIQSIDGMTVGASTTVDGIGP